MNSKQINFFIVPEDLPFVYDFFSRMNVIHATVNKKGPDFINLDEFPVQHETNPYQIYITHKDFASNIYTGRWKDGDLFIDYGKSWVLEFSLGGTTPGRPKVLDRARFYCTTSYFVSNGESVAKPDHFKKWVDKFFKTFKKEFLVKSDCPGIYFSPRTVEWMAKTGATVHKSYTQIDF